MTRFIRGKINFFSMDLKNLEKIRVKCFRKLILFIKQVSELKPKNKSFSNFLSKISVNDIEEITEELGISERMSYDYLETMRKIFE